MNAQDVIDKWGPKIDVGAVKTQANNTEPSPSATEEVLPTWMQRAATIVCRSGRGCG